MNIKTIVDLFQGYYAVSQEQGIKRVIHAARLTRQCRKDNESLVASTFAELERLQIENEKMRCWIRDLMIEADRASDALRQKNEFATGIALQLLESSVKETAWLMSTLHSDDYIEPDYLADIERKQDT